MITLFNLDQLSDPFMEGCRRAAGGLLGKFQPVSLTRAQEHIGTSPEKWTVHEWRRAAEILGHFADVLDERQRDAERHWKRWRRSRIRR